MDVAADVFHRNDGAAQVMIGPDSERNSCLSEVICGRLPILCGDDDNRTPSHMVALVDWTMNIK